MCRNEYRRLGQIAYNNENDLFLTLVQFGYKIFFSSEIGEWTVDSGHRSIWLKFINTDNMSLVDMKLVLIFVLNVLTIIMSWWIMHWIEEERGRAVDTVYCGWKWVTAFGLHRK